VVVSSEGVRFHEGDSQDIVKLQHFVPSWTLSEYFAASDNAEFWERRHEVFRGGTCDDDVSRRHQLIQEKFYIAGHSARFMFRSVEHVIK
jgi:5-formaminoimidazole-4-carboxamide-1-beta-D-ribofuranosyl 5'-monophosphate synthetase